MNKKSRVKSACDIEAEGCGGGDWSGNCRAGCDTAGECSGRVWVKQGTWGHVSLKSQAVLGKLSASRSEVGCALRTFPVFVGRILDKHSRRRRNENHDEVLLLLSRVGVRFFLLSSGVGVC